MAFNPFSTFRKYRKAMFAVLAIICMFTFVLTGVGGRNDLFNKIPELFGGGPKIPEAAKIDGKKIDGRMILDARLRRRMANDYMQLLFQLAGQDFMNRANTRTKDDTGIAAQMPTIVREKLLAAANHSGIYYGSTNQRRNQMMPVPPERALEEYITSVNMAIDRAKNDKKPDDAEYLTSLRTLLEQDRGRIRAIPTDPRLGFMFFGGSVHFAEDVLDFMVWKWEADRRKIYLAPKTVVKLVNQEILGEDSNLYNEKVIEFLAKNQYRNFNKDVLLEALTDEFRVRVAQAQVMGESGKLYTAPAVLTPDELRKSYDDEIKGVRTTLLPVAVEPFLAKVTETPTEKELEDLFNKHRKDEPNPRAERPGFMDPKRVKVEWIAGTPDSPYWRKTGKETAARDAHLIAAAVAQGGPALSGLVPSATWLGFAGAAKFEAIPEAHILREYDKYVKSERTRDWTYSALLFFQVHDTSVVRPTNIAAMVADGLASRGTGAPGFSAGTTLLASSVVQELRERTRFGLQTLAVGFNPNSIWGINNGLLPQPLPLAALRSKFEEELGVTQAKELFLAEFNKLQEEMKKKAKDLKKPETKAEVQKLIDDFAKKHGLTRGASTEMRDRYSVLFDPGLKTLHDAYFKDKSNTSDKLGENVTYRYFDQGRPSNEPSAYDPSWFSGRSPQFDQTLNEPFYLTWKTEETDPKVRDFKSARADVVAAWRRQKAQALAETAAKELQQKMKDQKLADVATIRQFAAENKITPIDLDPIARAKMMFPPLPNMPAMYQTPIELDPPQQQMMNPRPPTIPPEKVEYTTGMMVAEILKLRDKPRGETVILTDAPKAHYYVAVVVESIVPPDSDFQTVFTRSAEGIADKLLDQFEFERRLEHRKVVMQQLRATAKVTTVKEELEKFDGRGDGSED